jgi:hypothetical protein
VGAIVLVRGADGAGGVLAVGVVVVVVVLVVVLVLGVGVVGWVEELC